MSETVHPLDRLLGALKASGDADWAAAEYAEGVPAKGLLHGSKPLMVKMADEPWSMYDRWRCDEGYVPVLVEPSLFEGEDPAMIARFEALLVETIRQIRRDEAGGHRLGAFSSPIRKYDEW